jgi:hypothetical protein
MDWGAGLASREQQTQSYKPGLFRHVANEIVSETTSPFARLFASGMNLLPFFQWLEGTAGSVAIRESTLLYPIIETTHVLMLCLFLGMIAMLDLRLLGAGLRGIPVSEVAGRLLPLAFIGFTLMTISGMLLFYSGPVRAAGNIFFRIKMVMLALAGINAALFHVTIYRRVTDWDCDSTPPLRARLAGFCSLLLWSAVVICGRMQAYNWFDQAKG